MKKIIESIILALIISNVSVGKEPEIVFPKIGQKTLINEDYKNMQWNRYTTKNFVVMSIDNRDGEWLYKNLENIKKECLKKWGLVYNNLSTECRIMVVNDKDLFKKFFNLSDSRIEFRKTNEKIEVIGVWLCIEKHQYNEIEKIVSQICLEDILNKIGSNKKFIEEGAAILSLPKDKIINYLKQSNGDISILSIDKETYKSLGQEEKEKFLANSASFCLMLKKELGEKKFLKLMLSKKGDIEQVIDIYKYKNKEELEKTFKRYCEDLNKEIQQNKIKESYLKIEKEE